MAIRPRDLGLLGLGVLCLLLNFKIDLWDTDYRNFYDSAKAWLDGQPFYGLGVSYRPNLNPPWFAALIAPLTLLGLWPSYLVWTGLNLSLVGVTLWRLFTQRPDVPWPPVVLLVFLLTPAWDAWHQGQVVWMIFACVTCAWLSDSPVRAGLWLVPAIMLKPPLAIMALLLPWRTTLTAGIVSATGTLALVPLFGMDVWWQWLSSSDAIFWLANTHNGSLWGVVARLSHPAERYMAVKDLSPILLPLIALGGIAFAVPAYRTQNKDTRWSLAFLAHLFLSPLGWIYYVPAMAAPLVMAPQRGWWLVCPLLLWCIPSDAWKVPDWAILVMPVPWLIRSAGFATCVCVWLAVVTATRSARGMTDHPLEASPRS